MIVEWYWLYVGGLVAFIVAWVNGANNAANAIGSAVGSGALSVRRALWLTALFDLVGALLFGKYVSITLMRGIVDTSAISDSRLVVVGMTAALFSTALWVLVATFLRTPMSISQAIVGGILGFGIAALGLERVSWGKVAEIVSSWIYLPFVSIAMSILLYKQYARLIVRMNRFRLLLVAYSFTFTIFYTTAFLLLAKTGAALDLAQAVLSSTAIASISAAVLTAVCHYGAPRELGRAREWVFKVLLIISCMAMAFSHGANDVANSAGPLAGIIYVYESGYVPASSVEIPLVALALSALGIVLGIIMWGYRVVKTIGEEITTLTVESGFIAQFSASITILIVTRLGLPVSTTVAVVGAITGIGLARGIESVNFRTLFRIITTWIVSFPVVAGLSALMVHVLA